MPSRNVQLRRSCVPGRVTIAGTQQYTLTSAAAGRDYEIDVLLRADYERNTERRYPVLFVLDGQWDFELGEGHSSNKPETYSRGLRFVFGGKP